MNVADMVFVGFNKRVAALDKSTGEIIWSWEAEQGSGFVGLLLDGPRLFVAVNGYTYCLDPKTGQQLWLNPMKGYGTGVTSLAATGGHTHHAVLGEAAAEKARAAAAASGS